MATSGLIGRKLGMTRLFADDGTVTPVTIIEAGPCRVVQVREGAVQLGWGAHRDYVQAYVWLSEGIAGGNESLRRWRDKLVEKMTAEQVAQAKERAGP